MEFKLKFEFIELDNLLKVTNLAVNGAQAKQFIMEDLVKVNGQVETHIRRKLRKGDCVEFGQDQINIVGTKI